MQKHDRLAPAATPGGVVVEANAANIHEFTAHS